MTAVFSPNRDPNPFAPQPLDPGKRLFGKMGPALSAVGTPPAVLQERHGERAQSPFGTVVYATPETQPTLFPDADQREPPKPHNAGPGKRLYQNAGSVLADPLPVHGIFANACPVKLPTTQADDPYGPRPETRQWGASAGPPPQGFNDYLAYMERDRRPSIAGQIRVFPNPYHAQFFGQYTLDPLFGGYLVEVTGSVYVRVLRAGIVHSVVWLREDIGRAIENVFVVG